MKYLTRFKVQKVIRALKDELVSGPGVREKRPIPNVMAIASKVEGAGRNFVLFLFLMPFIEDSGISCRVGEESVL